MKKILLAILISSLLFMSGCSNNDFTLTLDQAGEEYYIYNGTSSSVVIYTNFGEIKVNFEDETIDLSEALDKNKITMLDIMSKVGYSDGLNDGGSLVYQYENDDDFANVEFTIVDCHGTDRIVIGNTPDVADRCRGDY